MKRDREYAIVTLIAVVIIFGLSFWLTANVWSECRQTNSFWYCVRLISK